MGSRISGGYPDAAWFEDVSSCINPVNFEPWFDDAGWDEGTIRPEDLIGIAGDDSSVSLGPAGEYDSIPGDAYAMETACKISLSSSGDAVRIQWGYVPGIVIEKHLSIYLADLVSALLVSFVSILS